MYRIHIPAHLTEDEESHLNQILAKYDESFGNASSRSFMHGIPPFDKNFHQPIDVMESVRHISERQEYSAFVHRSEIASLVIENSFLSIHSDMHPRDAGIATQIPQIIAEEDAFSNARIFVIRSNNILCSKACDIVKSQMCLEDTPTIQTYHPMDERKAQSDTKILFLTTSSFLHLMLTHKDPECIVILEDASSYFKLKERKDNLGDQNSRDLANYELLWGVVQQLASNERFRFLMCASQQYKENTTSLMSALTQSSEKIISLASLHLQGVNTEEVWHDIEKNLEIRIIEKSFLESFSFRTCNENILDSLDVILTDDIDYFTQFHSNIFHDSAHPLLIHPNRNLTVHEIEELEKQNTKPIQYHELSSKSTSHVILADFFDISLADTIHEIFGGRQIRTMIFIQFHPFFSTSELNSKKSFNFQMMHVFLQDISQKLGAKINLGNTTAIYLCQTPNNISGDCDQLLLNNEYSSHTEKKYFCMMKKAFKLQSCFESFLSQISSVFDTDTTQIDQYLRLRRTTCDNDDISPIGKAECLLSYLTTNMLVVRFLVFAAWFSCPSFGCLAASLIKVSERLHGVNASCKELVDIVRNDANYFLTHLQQQGFIQNEFCKNNILLHRCVVILSFFPDIALPVGNQIFRNLWSYIRSHKVDIHYLHASIGCLSNKLVQTTAKEREIYPFTHVLSKGNVQYLVDLSGGYFTDIDKFYTTFFPLPRGCYSAQYCFNNFPVIGKMERTHFYNAISVIILIGSFLKESQYKIDYRNEKKVSSIASSQNSKEKSSSRGWVKGFSRAWSSEKKHHADILSENFIKMKFVYDTGRSILTSKNNSFGDIAVAHAVRFVAHNNAMLKHFMRLRERFNILIERSIYSPFPIEFLQVIDWTLQKCFSVENRDPIVEENVFWKSFTSENPENEVKQDNVFGYDQAVSSMDALMIEKFAQSVAALQDRSFENFCREFIVNPMSQDTNDQLRCMLGFLDQGKHNYSSYQARLLSILPNMPKFHAPYIKKSKELQTIRFFSRSMLRFIDEIGGESIQNQRKKLRADIKLAQKVASKESCDQETPNMQLKTISILSDINEEDVNRHRKTVNTNVELLHATERELEDAVAAVLVEPLPLKKATNLNLPLILAKALGEILDAKVGPTCLLSDYAHIQVPSKKVADAALKLESFMCLGEMVHIHKNCYIVKHKNHELTRKLDVIRSKGK